jgi:hypothetical protein
MVYTKCCTILNFILEWYVLSTDVAQEIKTVPTTQVNQIVSDSIKHAGNGVAQYIFNTDVKNAKWGETDCSSFRDELAVKLVAWTVTMVRIDF